MSVDAWITVGITVLVFVALVREIAPADLLFLAATALLAMLGIITTEQAFSGFANPGVLMVAVLFVVAAGLRETGLLDYVGQHILGSVKSERKALARLAGLVLPLSAFLNNTPIVAMLMPVTIDWCRRQQSSPSRLLIPLSFLAILGGTCTLIGTSTNLVVNGLMVSEHTRRLARPDSGDPAFTNELRGMNLLEITWVGLPYALIGTAYLMLTQRRLLPERKELLEQLGESRREYLVEMLIHPGCRLIGKTVEEAGLRQLPGLFLIEIDRDGKTIGPVGPDEIMEQGDRLIFTGIVSSIVDLERIPGLVPAADPTYEITPSKQKRRHLVEVVISATSPLVGKTIREADFRAAYGAAVVAVHRSGERVTSKIGDVELRPGDTLLLQTRPHFLRAHRNDSSFYLISNVEEWRPLRRDRAWIALALFAGLIGLMTTGVVEPVVAGSLVAALMVLLGCISAGDARKSVEWQVLVTIAASFGLGTALQSTGAAYAISKLLVESIQAWGAIAALATFYLLASVLTAVITNNAAAVLLFPFCVETAAQLEVSPRPFLVALMLAASASFATPIGYQTNMMVYGPGGYRFLDFVRIGLPLNLLLWVTALLLIPLFWTF